MVTKSVCGGDGLLLLLENQAEVTYDFIYKAENRVRFRRLIESVKMRIQENKGEETWQQQKSEQSFHAV
ncbi:MAG: hypothetical protein J5986_06795 [Roseburia sp.]|nr:hypothetical protein [Roseburia sp.]